MNYDYTNKNLLGPGNANVKLANNAKTATKNIKEKFIFINNLWV